MWFAVDRNRNQIIDITVSKSRDKSVFVRIAQRLERKGYKVKIMCRAMDMKAIDIID